MTNISVVVVGIAIFHLIVPLLASENSRHDARKKVLEWLAEDPAFAFSDKLEMRDGRILVEETIEADEVLMVIPASKILTMYDEEEDDETSFCLLYEYLDYEIGLGEESLFAPYLFQILQEQESDILLPSLWSSTAQRLILLVSITSPNYDIVSLIDDYSDCIYLAQEEDDDEDDDNEGMETAFVEDHVDEEHQENGAKHKEGSSKVKRAMVISPDDKADRLILALAIKHQIDQTYFVPLYDQLPHHHLTYNVKHNVRDDATIEVVALKTIHAGEDLYRQTRACLRDCDNHIATTVAIDTLKKYGEVQPYPHLWKLGNELSFIYNGKSQEPIEDTVEGKIKSVKWINPPTRESQLEIMEAELKRQRKTYKKEVLLSRDSVDPSEWQQIDRYCRSLMGALKDAIKEGYEYLETLEMLERNWDSVSDDDSEVESKEASDQITETENGVDETCHAKDVTDEQYQEEQNAISGSDMKGTSKKMFDQIQHDSLGHFPVEADDPWFVKGCGTSERCNMVHIAKSRGCNTYDFNARRNQTEWATMRSAYIATVGPQHASIELSYGTGFRVAIKIGHSPGRGRGVFATADIPKGTLVWQSEYTATFEHGFQFRRFLSVLPDDMVCDLLFWCYTLAEEGGHIIACDLDESSLFNHADHRFEYNIGEIPEAEAQQQEKKTVSTREIDSAFSLRDIEAGEELITSYDEFHSDGFEEMGMM